MKAQVYNNLNIKPSINFNTKIAKLLNTGITEIDLWSVGMEWKGRGYYNYFLKVYVNSEEVILRQHTTDSQAYDYYKDLKVNTVKFDNWCKNVSLMLIEDNQGVLLELVC